MLKTKLLAFALFSFLLLTLNADAASTWTGNSGTAWGTAGNWSGGVPTSTSDVIIPATTNKPIITGSALTIKSLTISGTTTLTLSAALTVTTSLTVNGNFTIQGGSLLKATTVTVNAFTFTINTPLTSLGLFVTNGSTVISNSPGVVNTAGLSMVASALTFNAVINSTASVQIPNGPGNVTLTTNASGNSFSAGVYDHTGGDLTWNGSGTTTCTTGDVSSGQTLTIGKGNKVTFSDDIVLHGSTSTVGLLVNNGTINTSKSVSSNNITVTPMVAAITNGPTGTINLTTSSGQITVGNSTGISNSGIINCASTTKISTASPSFISNTGTGQITLNTATMTIAGSCTLTNDGQITENTLSLIDFNNGGILSNSGSITLNTISAFTFDSVGSLTNSGSITLNTISKLTTGNGTAINNTVNGSIILNTASTANFNGSSAGTIILNNDGAIKAYTASTISLANPRTITNSATGSIVLDASILNLPAATGVDNSGIISAVSGSAVNLSGAGSYIKDVTSGSSLTITASTVDIAAGANITNSGTMTSSGSATFKMDGTGSVITNNINATINATSTTFTMAAGSAVTNTGGSVTMTTSTLTGTGNANTITNDNSGSTIGTFVMDDTDFILNGTGKISNTGTFTAKGGSTINMTNASGSTTSFIKNSGTFIAGVTLPGGPSSCVITLNCPQALLENLSGGTFTLGSTSIIYPTSASGQMKNDAGGTFTLQSDSYGSAAIGPTPTSPNPSPTLVGTYNVERFFQGSLTWDPIKNKYAERGYRIISSAVNTGTAVNGNNVMSFSYIAGTGGTGANSITNAFVTGATGGSTSAGNPTLYLYRENKAPSNTTFTSGNFIGITNIVDPTKLTTTDGANYAVPTGNGVLFFFRGAATQWAARTGAFPYLPPESVTLTATGLLNQGPIVVKDWYTPASTTLGYSTTAGNDAIRGFNMVGNPYPSTIDWYNVNTSGITATDIDPTMYVLNPKTYQYESYSYSNNTGNPSTRTGKIVSGQGFFVRSVMPTPVHPIPAPKLTFNETAKAPTSQLVGSDNLLMGTPAKQASIQLLRLKMVADSLNYDDIVLGFSPSASNKFDYFEDSKDLGGMGALEGLTAFSSDSVGLAVDVLPLPKVQPAVVRLGTSSAISNRYTLQRTQLDSIPKLYEVWLMDKFKKDSLDLRNNSSYVFDVDLTDTATYGNNRFTVVIRQNQALGVHLLNFTAVKAAGGSQIEWKTENEEAYTNFTVQRSTDNGVTFDVAGGFGSNSQGTYNLLDKNPVNNATNIYRLKIEDLNGTISYSKSVSLVYGTGSNTVAANTINVYPNPAVSTINLAINTNRSNNLISGVQSVGGSPAQASNQSYAIKIVNITGNVVKTATSSQPTWQDDVATLLPGTYIIQVVNNSDKSLVGKTTFVKM